VNVLALGGAGYIGRPASRMMAADDVVTRIVIAGRNKERARSFAATLGSKVTAAEVEAHDEDALRALIADCDIVVNTTGGDADLIIRVLGTAIAFGRPYCDVTGGWQATGCLLALDGRAKTAGVTAIIGIGSSPGKTNLLAMHAATKLDRVDEIQACFVQGTRHWTDEIEAYAGGSGASEHASGTMADIIHGASGTIRVFRDGEWRDVRGFERFVEAPLPGRDATVKVYDYGNSEPITLPKHIPGVRNVACMAALSPPQLNDLLRQESARVAGGEATPEEAAASFFATIAGDREHWLMRAKDVPPNALFTVAIGEKDGRPARYTCCLGGLYRGDPEPSGAYTAAPMALAALKILKGEVGVRGVLPPEACLEPMPFFTELSRWWMPPPEDGQVLIDSFAWLD
jgi:saccharopine dehydrogenase-like NADP-dependent oxidoreductase